MHLSPELRAYLDDLNSRRSNTSALPPPAAHHSTPPKPSFYHRLVRSYALDLLRRYLPSLALFVTVILNVFAIFYLLVVNDFTSAHTSGFLVPWVLLMVGVKALVPVLSAVGNVRRGREGSVKEEGGYPRWVAGGPERVRGGEAFELQKVRGGREMGR